MIDIIEMIEEKSKENDQVSDEGVYLKKAIEKNADDISFNLTFSMIALKAGN